MTAACILCGAIITGQQASAAILNPGADLQEVQSMMELAEFDLLAARFANHLNSAHPGRAEEMAAVQFLAGKVFAMTFAQSATVPRFALAREAWRAGVVNQLSVEFTAPDQAAAAAPAPAPSSGGSSGPPSGSNEKNDARKFSN